MEYLVYLSTAQKLMDQNDLLDILTASRYNNIRHNLTGMLLYGEGTFIQLLEGDPETLKQTYQTIEADSRHHNIIKMAQGEITERYFPEWAMGFKSANATELAEFKGYINPDNKSFLQQGDTDAIIGMLKTFADVNRM
ncbi:BLUF domain-containing protein [Mucilaginibacter sp. Bleaf8]|uniref:BLUF domain-containing protein n=1 Tax=Mucilaginibacter sp. Bleaf8 TaxID=2834430 RepID=UPI001BCD55C0|nr:BLUF domain-containing protein [Mucilaginibacter sp. Bleaf8]MBS7564557.1 BLUF domain-containing protein [Mucilaginibacter sp. Bleaf8]